MVGNFEFGAIVFGLLSAASFGAGDFSGGMATRRLPVLGVIAVSHGAGLILLVTLALLTGEVFPTAVDIMWGAAAGTMGMLGLACLYRALAIGRAGVVAPITGVVGAVLPVVVAFITAGLPSELQLIGFVVGLVSVWLVSGDKGSSSRTSIGLSLAAGLFFGVFFVFFAQVSEAAFFWPLTAARVASFSITLIAATMSRAEWMPSDRSALGIVILAGLLDVGGNAFYVLATRTGRLDIAAVMSALFPAMTILLAWVILKERLSRVQFIGVAAALAAIALIAAG
jgi:drug/metabolite transporter (DMT)-like permease